MANYLYNGVKLPGWGASPHPYAVLYEVEFDSIVGKAHSYEVVFSKTPFLWVSGDHLLTGITDSVCGYSMNLLQGETEWGELIEKTVDDYYETGYLGTYPIWANHDVYVGEKEIGGPYYATEELYLAASDPVPVTTFTISMILGWLMGRKVAGQRAAEPVAAYWLYNGLKCPALPEWNKETHPYVILCYNDNDPDSLITNVDTITVYFLQALDITHNNGTLAGHPSYLWHNPGDLRLKSERPKASTEDFPPFGEFEVQTERKYRAYSAIDWSNTDLYDGDGVLYLAASEPVPVYASEKEGNT